MKTFLIALFLVLLFAFQAKNLKKTNLCSSLSKGDCSNKGSCNWCDGECKQELNPQSCGKPSFATDDPNSVFSMRNAGTINVHTGGKLVITEHPDFSKFHVDQNSKK